MDFINSFFSENLIRALGWTIIHSLWQGAAAALGLAMVMLFMRRSGARIRYIVGTVALTLVLVMSLVTFASIYSPGVQGTTAAGGNGSALALTGAVKIESGVTLTIFFKNYFNRHLPVVVTVWMLGILVLMLRFAGGYLFNQRLKLHRSQQLPASWQNRLETFCRKTGIDKPIRLVESALVKVPMTIGHFKPIILFPLGLVTGLPPEQVEALLAHELAHITRKDYLINILQNFVDILFFYHPGVRWISSQIRVERENCCDDIAVSLSGDSLNVAKALTNIQDYDLRTLEPAIAAAGKKSGQGLLARVRRLLSPSAQGSNFSAGTVIAFIMVVGLLTLVLTANAAAGLNRDGQSRNSHTVKSVPPVEDEQHKEEELKEKEEKEKEELIKLAEETKEREEMLRRKGLLPRDPSIKRKSREEVLKERELTREREEQMGAQREHVREERAITREKRQQARIQRKELRHPIQLFYEVLVPQLLQDKLISDKKDFEFRIKNGKLYVNGEEQPEAVYKKYIKLYEKTTGKKLDVDKGIDLINRR